MKNILLFLLAVLTLSSCEKDDAATLYDSGLLKSIKFEGESAKHNENIIVKYDDMDRVFSINDTLFYYGLNNKVTYSRYTENINKDGYNSAKIIRKSYQWDEQNRIQSITVDSIYQKIIGPTGAMTIADAAPYVEAYFYYSGVQSLPDSIGCSTGNSGTPFIFKRYYHSHGNFTKIEDMEAVPLDGLANSIILKSTFIDYSDEPNYLYPLYAKLGFLPKGLGYVSARNLPASSEIVETILVSTNDGQHGNKGSTVKKIYSSSTGTNGFPSRINTNTMIDFDNGTGYANTGSTATYIYY